MQDTVQTKQKSNSTVQGASKTSVTTEIDKLIIRGIALGAGAVGVWAIACLTSAMFQSGGPLGLAGGWFKAVSGM